MMDLGSLSEISEFQEGFGFGSFITGLFCRKAWSFKKRLD